MCGCFPLTLLPSVEGYGISLPIPADDEADTGRKQTGAEAAVEPGEETAGNTGNVFQTDTQGDHKSNNEVTFDAESPEDAGLFICQRQDTFRILPDNTCKHHIEPGKHQNRQRYHPNQGTGTPNLTIASYTDGCYFDSDSSPKDAVDRQKLYRLDS